MSHFVVEKSPDAQLLGGRSVPASPIASARRLMTENSVKPVAVFVGNGTVLKMFQLRGIRRYERRLSLTCCLLANAIRRSPWIITAFRYSAILSCKHQTVRAVVKLRLSVNTLPISIAVRSVANHTRFQLTWVFLLSLLAMTQTYVRK